MGNSIVLFDISMEISSRQFYFGDVGYAVISLRSCPLPIIPLCLELKKQRSQKNNAWSQVTQSFAHGKNVFFNRTYCYCAVKIE